MPTMRQSHVIPVASPTDTVTALALASIAVLRPANPTGAARSS